jgi:hypothetical protein
MDKDPKLRKTTVKIERNLMNIYLLQFVVADGGRKGRRSKNERREAGEAGLRILIHTIFGSWFRQKLYPDPH